MVQGGGVERLMKAALWLIGLGGAVAFGLALALTYASPILVERAAREFMQAQIRSEVAGLVDLKSEEADQSRVGQVASVLTNRHEKEAAAIRKRLAVELDSKIENIVTRMQNADCECRDRSHRLLHDSLQYRVMKLESARPQLTELIEGNYGRISQTLLSDFKTFACINFAAFTALIILLLVRGNRGRQLTLPAALLATSTIIAIAIYIFGQNWFFSILYGSYAGFVYGLWLLIVFGLLIDVALFKARATTAILDLVGTSLSKMALPC